MNKHKLACMIKDIADEFYTPPTRGMSNKQFKEAAYKKQAVKSLCNFIRRYPIETNEQVDTFRVICIISEFDDLMVLGMYQSQSKNTKLMYEIGRDVCNDATEIFMDIFSNSLSDGKE